MSAIFISHSSQDNDLARELERRLAQRNHHSVFLDLDPEKGLVGGQSWERTLYRKLRACRAVIALCTDHYLASHWCFAEIALARMEGKQIVALKADPLDAKAQLPAILSQDQFIDLRSESDEGLQRLWRALAELDLPAVAGEWDPKQPPYLGLSAYQEMHAPVFFGREAESLAGIELLERGAPNLVMVLGASGSGKSSLVLAGMLPRLRAREAGWLVVDPFRPGRDPMGELAESLARSHARLAREPIERRASAEELRQRLRAALDAAPTAGRVAPTEALIDERLHRLVDLLQRLRADPPLHLDDRLRDHLAWSLDDLQRLVDANALPSLARPSESPRLVDIARDIGRVAQRRDARVLIVIDQFEELLGQQPAAREAERFLEALRAAVDADHSPVMVLATMRSDFLGLFQRHPALQGVDFESLSLGPMRIDGMRRVIEMPARLAAIEIEPGVVERLLEDTATPDALPLLSFTLSVLYRDRSDSGRLGLADYERAGGLQGTIAREADAVLAAAVRNRQEDELRIALLHMARLGEDGSHARVAVEWNRPEIQRAKPILDQLVERRVLVSRIEGDTPVVEVAHEALFRIWPPLRAWLDNARAELLLRQQLERDAATWQASGRIADHLWRGGRLQQAKEWLDKAATGRRGADLTSEFVRAGLWRRGRLRVAVAGTTLGVVGVLAGFLWYSLDQTDQARRERAKALDLVRVSVAADWLEKDPTRAALVLLDVEDPEGTRFAPRRLSEALHRGFARAEYRHTGPVHSVAINAEGTRVVTTSGLEASIWDAQSGRRLSIFRHEEPVTAAAFDPTGRLIVVRAGEVGNSFHGDRRGGRAWVHDVAAGKVLFPISHDKPLTLATFSPDGRLLLTASEDGSARVWDVANGQSKALAREAQKEDKVVAATFSRDGRLLATASEKLAQLWAAADGRAVGSPIEHDGLVEGVAFNPDGTLVAVAGSRGVQVHDVAAGAPKYPTLDHSFARSVSFSTDGRWLLSASGKEARVWLVETGASRFAEPIVHEQLRVAAFSADGSLVITAPGHADRRGYGSPPTDNSLRFWDAQTGQSRLVKKLQLPHEVMTVAFDAGARVMVGNSADRVGGGRNQTLHQNSTARLWNVEPRDLRRVQVLDHDAPVSAAAFSLDGSRVMTVAGEVIRVWDRSAGKPPVELRHAKFVHAASLSADGRFVVSASNDGAARIWDVASGHPRFVARHAEEVRHALLLPDGRRLATYSAGRLRLWDVVDGKAEASEAVFELNDYNARLDDTIDGGAIAPDGNRIAARVGEAVQVWDVDQPRAAAPRFTLRHGGYVRKVAFIAGGQYLVTGADEKAAHVWDMKTGDERFALDHGAQIRHVAVSPDGRTVLTVGDDGTARLWDSETGKELHKLPHGCGLREGRFVDGSRLVATRSLDDGFKSECDSKVILWDVATGQLRASMTVADGGDVEFSHDGRRMFSRRSLRGEIRPGAAEALSVWDADTGEARFAEAFVSPDDMRGAEFSRDGRLLLTAAGTQVSVWAIAGRELQAALAAAITVCLSSEFRRQNLGETDAEARRKQAACERKHGRG